MSQPTALAPLIDVDGLTVTFPWHGGRRAVVRDVSFSIRPGEVLALVGESGSGKSVTSRSLVGLAGRGSEVTANRLTVTGRDVRSLRSRDWRRIRGRRVGFVLQDALASLDNLRRIGDEVAEPLRLHTPLTRRQRDARVLELLAESGIPDPSARVRQYPYELSGGLRQRALIASAIANRPPVLIADEPTTALDATVAAQILRLLGGLVGDDGALLVISHDLAAVATIADRIAVMRDGRIIEEGSTAEVIQDPREQYTKALLAAIPSRASRGQRLSTTPRSTEGRTADRGHSAAGSAPLIEARGLVKTFRGQDGTHRTVVDDVSFTLVAGETLGIVGESGSGKTTLARMALGVERPTEGQVLVRGEEWSALSGVARVLERRRIQAVSQDPLSSFDPRYTVGRVILEPLAVVGLRGATALQRARELLDLVRLPADTLERRPLELSGGQRQRVAIARALALEPDVIVADEPVSALDVSVQAQILDLFDDVKREYSVAYLFISHDLGVIHHVADRVLVMRDARIVEHGDIDDVFDNPQQEYTRELLDAIPHITFDHRPVERVPS